MKFEHEGNIYATTEANHCDACEFFWRDGGIYDACLHPDQELVKRTCGREQRLKGNNVIWMKLKPWMTLDHCPDCQHRKSQHDMNCIECCPVQPLKVTPVGSKLDLTKVTKNNHGEMQMTRNLLLTHVTLTGIDDRTDLNDLCELSKQYPFVEWGILYSPKREGQGGRYPSVEFIHSFLTERPSNVRMALHVCGDGVQQLLSGDSDVLTDLIYSLGIHGGRVQLNFNQRKKPVEIESLSALFKAYPHIQFITQHNEANQELWRSLIEHPNHSVLFDSSGGQGIECQDYTTPLPCVQCGYAGGLGPDNLASELKRIEAIAGSRRYWVDMESRLRDQDDRFSLNLAQACLSACV